MHRESRRGALTAAHAAAARDDTGPGRLLAPLTEVAVESVEADRRETGDPHPVVRAALGLLLGLTAGVLVALLTPRPQRAARAPGLGTADEDR